MKWEGLLPPLIHRALEIFLAEAYPVGPPANKLFWREVQGQAELFGLLEDESRSDGDRRVRRYCLRLGSARYPFMKFVIEEYLVRDEFFFTVDTHDQMEVKSSIEDEKAWLSLKEENLSLKRRIEARWSTEGIPTFRELKQLVEQAPHAGKVSKRRTIMIVEDEEDIAAAVAQLLEAEGYDVVEVNDGEEALALARKYHPDLVILDYMLPRMDGLEVCRRLKEHQETADIPVLLASVSLLGREEVKLADGFLIKPYQMDILFPYVKKLIRSTPDRIV